MQTFQMRDQYKLMKAGRPCVGITAERALRLAELGFVFENAKHKTIKSKATEVAVGPEEGEQEVIKI